MFQIKKGRSLTVEKAKFSFFGETFGKTKKIKAATRGPSGGFKRQQYYCVDEDTSRYHRCPHGMVGSK